jgi:FtsP/CotA-like multicopper oxidase with cupredoxin domain
MKTIFKTSGWLLATSLAAMIGAPIAANAVTYDMCVGEVAVTMPDGAVVDMWGYALDTGAAGCGDDTPSVPGPELRNPAGDTSLTINLTNSLLGPGADSVSIVIPGQVQAMSPVFFTDGNGRQRMRSMTAETPVGQTSTYIWSNVKAGTFAYHSGTHVQVQVQMGLYGAFVTDTATNTAYPGVSYDDDLTLVYSEIDPALHQAVAAGDYGTTITSTIDYNPRYFLINGRAYDPGMTPADQAVSIGAPGSRTLLRFVNMGLQDHFPVLQGLHAVIVAEDGNPYTYGRTQYSIELPPSKTKDAVITVPLTAAGGDLIAVVDRALNLTNASMWDGGMLTHLAVASGPAADAVSMIRARYRTQGGRVRIWAATDDPGATLSYNSLPMTYCNNANGDCAPTNTTGDYFYIQQFTNAPNPGTVTVTSSAGGSAATIMPFSVPVQAASDAYMATEDTLLAIAAPGVLGNDDAGPSQLNHPTAALNAVIDTDVANGTLTLNPDGSFSYAPNADFNGSDSFTYVADAVGGFSGGVGSSGPVEVFITVDPQNDSPPVAVPDAYTVNAAGSLNVPAAGVLTNDTDADGDPLTAVLAAGPDAGSSLTLNADGSFSYTPNPALTSDSFTYFANDGFESSLSPAVVSITIDATPPPNVLPVAIDDFAAVSRRNRGVVTADLALNPGIIIDLVDNDMDADGLIDPLTVTLVSLPARGVVTNLGNGSIRFQPPRSRGTQLFTYTVNDNANGTSNVATVRINVTR